MYANNKYGSTSHMRYLHPLNTSPALTTNTKPSQNRHHLPLTPLKMGSFFGSCFHLSPDRKNTINSLVEICAFCFLLGFGLLASFLVIESFFKSWQVELILNFNACHEGIIELILFPLCTLLGGYYLLRRVIHLANEDKPAKFKK